jgi:hypothetical protein
LAKLEWKPIELRDTTQTELPHCRRGHYSQASKMAPARRHKAINRKGALPSPRKIQQAGQAFEKPNTQLQKDTPGGCEICNKIISRVSPSNHQHYIHDLGTYHDLVEASPCERHRRLIQEIYQLSDLKISNDPLQIYTGSDPRYPGLLGSPILPLAPHSTQSTEGYARIANPKWIDLHMLKKWKNACEKNHQECKEWALASHLGHVFPRLLIDTWLQCLVPTPDGVKYVALSYIWGDVQPVCANRTILNRLCAPRSLKTGALGALVPRTIRHAISLTEILGERYLWVDSLCIVQDDVSAVHSELSNMSSIFANATLTIIAANGRDADHGLLGLPAISEPRRLRQNNYNLGRGHAVAIPSPGRTTSNLYLWQSRGWTYQENVFSRKKLVFFDNSVAWECSSACWPEFVHLDSTDPSWLTKIIAHSPDQYGIDFTSNAPRIQDVALAIDHFNVRHLTYPEDALGAFSGVLSIFQRQYHGGFVSGLPVVFFNYGLLWQSERVTRRVPKNKHSGDACLPSWSWAGWSGDIRFWSWRLIAGTQLLPFAVRTLEYATLGLWQDWKDSVSSTIQWYSHERHGSKGAPIDCTWTHYKQLYTDNLDIEPPMGWTRRPMQAYLNSTMWCQTCCDVSLFRSLRYTDPRPCTHGPSLSFSAASIPRCYYTHETRPTQAYLFPIPAPRQDQAQPIIEASFISCKTLKAHFIVAEPFRERPYMLSIRNETGKWVGVLNVQNNNRTPATLFNKTLEFVEIAQGKFTPGSLVAPYVMVEWECDECPKTPSTLYEFYYVLWVEWKDGIAYREGMGRILKDAWEARDKEEIDLLLG